MPARVKVEQGPNGSDIRPDHPDGSYGTLALMQAFGTGSTAFMDGLADYERGQPGQTGE